MPVSLKVLLPICPLIFIMPSFIVPWLYLKSVFEKSYDRLVNDSTFQTSRRVLQQIDMLTRPAEKHAQQALTTLSSMRNCMTFALHVLTVAHSTSISGGGFVQHGAQICIISQEHPSVYFTTDTNWSGDARPVLWEQKLDATWQAQVLMPSQGHPSGTG